MGRVKVIKGGIMTTIQDLGRFGYQSWGVPQSGAMDTSAFSLGNIALGNSTNAPGLECTIDGPTLKMEDDAVLCITGADMSPTIDGRPCPLWQTVYVPQGAILEFQRLRSGCRSYINFRGGLINPLILGSASAFFKEAGRQKVKSGDVLLTGNSPGGPVEVVIPEELRNIPFGNQVIRALPGPQDNLFNQEAQRVFWTSEFQVSEQANRMGYRLVGPAIKSENTLSVLSQGIPLGAIQVDGEGTPIVLLRDRQTVGGYPVIATVITVDVDLFAQLKPGDTLHFKPVMLEQAVGLLQERTNQMKAFQKLIDKI